MMMMSSHTSVVSRPCLRADEGDDEGDEDGDDERRLGRGGIAEGGHLAVGEDVGDALGLGVGVVPRCAVGVVDLAYGFTRGHVAEVVDAGVRDRLDGVGPDGVHEALEDVRGARDGTFNPGGVVFGARVVDFLVFAEEDRAFLEGDAEVGENRRCLLYTSPSPRDLSTSRMPSSA